jgi:hypothetical protein
MRKLILISAFVLASVSAQAGQSRNLVLAANDEPQATEAVTTAKPAVAQPEAAKTDVKSDVKADAAQPEAAKPYAAKPVRKAQVRRYEGDEAKARRIAAHYGVYW